MLENKEVLPMARIPNRVKRIIDKYIIALNNENFQIQNVFLFSSYAKGKNNEWSDIDLAVVSKIFEGMRIKDRDKIRRITLDISSDIEVLPFNPKDFTKDNPLVKEILESGIKIL